jgi:Protein of unknown function (DUF3999)
MTKIIAALIFATISLTVLAADAPLKPTNFAYGMALQTDGRDGVYKINVPLDVYRVVRYADLRDVRVFNADGEVVPHVVTRAAGSVSVKSEPIELPRFPVYASGESKFSDLDLQIKRDSQGTVINLSNRSGITGQNKLVGYLLDGSKVGPAIKEIELQWSDSIANYVGSVTVEASDDLANWRSLAKDAPVTRMKFGDHLLDQRRVKFPPTPLIYLRLSWPALLQNETALPELTRVLAIPADASADVQRTWLTVAGQPLPNKPGEYEFDIGALAPIDRIHVELPQMNTLVQTELLARGSVKEPWQNVTQTLVYRVTQNGRAFNSDDLQINRDSRRHWLLRIAQQGGGLGTGVPSLKVGWLADQVLFLARGRGPFQLAYGAEGVKSGEVAITALMMGGDGKDGIQAQSIGVGSQVALGGESRLASVSDPFPWKKWTLWGVLGLGVILMGWMASRLMGQMNRENQFENKDAKP